MGRQEVLGSLQAGRWLAASGVVLVHAVLATFPIPLLTEGVASYFPLGVDFFFVLSGFIILTAHESDGRGPQAAAVFARKRAVRIFVPYLPLSILAVVLYLRWPQLGDEDWSVVKSLTLLPVDGEPALSVAWTLVHELVFYAIFGILFYAKWLLPGIVMWAAAILIGMLFRPLGQPFATILAPINFEFMFGMAAVLVARALPVRLWGWVLATGVVMLIVVAPYTVDNPDLGPHDGRLLAGAALAIITVGLVVAERSGRISVPRTFLILGAASYAVYLLHGPVIAVLDRFLGGVNSYAAIGAYYLGAMLIGLAYYRFFERPMLRRFSVRTSRPSGDGKPSERQPALVGPPPER